jgi:hypothetical protein
MSLPKTLEEAVMWAILKRQCSAVWYVSQDDSGRVVIEHPERVDRLEPSVLELLDDARESSQTNVESYELQGHTVVVSSFDEGSVAVLASPGSNTMTIKAALRRWPGAIMVREANQGFDRDIATARMSASRELLAGSEPRTGGLDELTDVADYESLDLDSFAEESVLGGASSHGDQEQHAETRVMACTWIQVVEHFGRIAEALDGAYGGVDVLGRFAEISSPLGGLLRVSAGEFSTRSPSDRVGRADAEAVDAIYNAWIASVARSCGVDVREEFPSVDATPWRGLLVERDAPVEEIAFSF